MADKLSDYLDSFKASLKIDSAIKDDVAQEICTHLEDKSQELKENGLSEEEAIKAATESFGSPQLIAQQIYQTHAQGSWQEAFFAALPHFLIAAMFASYYWQNIICLSVTLTATVGVVIYGWCYGKPIWLAPWLGYYLLPVIITAILLIYLSKGWGWIATLIYIPLALFAVIYIVRQTVRRDWLYTLLMLVPLPVVFSWLLSSGIGSELLTSNLWMARLQTKVPWITISFLTLAAATVTFIRMRSRWGKIISLVAPSTVILFSVTLASRGNIGLWGWLILALCLPALATPVWLQAKS